MFCWFHDNVFLTVFLVSETVNALQVGKSDGEISAEREPLIEENHTPENYSVVAAILP